MNPKIYICLGSLAFIYGCSTPASNVAPTSGMQPKPPAYQRQVYQIETSGIQVIQRGDRLTMIIPTDAFFEPGTTMIREERQENLQQMAKFAKYFADTYPDSIVRITGYTDRVFSHRTQLELSQSYAEAISSYIFDAGVDPKRIATFGRGGQDPVAEEYKPKSAAMNRRVVVQVN